MKMTKNTCITIASSPELSAMRLDDLEGCRGLVVEIIEGNSTANRGAMVVLEVPYLDEYLWFIHETSISYE